MNSSSTKTSSSGAGQTRYCPAHVPPNLVRSLDTYNDPGIAVDPFGTLLANQGDLPIYWNDIDAGFRKGCWVLTRAADVRAAGDAPDIFQSKNWVNFQALVGETWPLIPNSLDGDLHKTYRTLMAPWFSPVAVARLSDKLVARATELIEGFETKGSCEFIEAFASPFPVTVFMQIMGLPLERMAEFVGWENALLRGSDFTSMAEATANVLGAMRALIEDRRAAPADDLATQIVNGRVEDRPITGDEVLSIVFALFLGGLDTVASALGLFFHELASNTELQARLRLHPDKIPAAVDELLRVYSPVTARRQLGEDIELHGVRMKAGDWVSIPTALANRDPEAFPEPDRIDLERENRRHLAFITGPHFCLGHVLARRELTVAVTVMLERLPPFRIADPAGVRFHGGVVIGMDRLPLAWG